MCKSPLGIYGSNTHRFRKIGIVHYLKRTSRRKVVPFSAHRSNLHRRQKNSEKTAIILCGKSENRMAENLFNKRFFSFSDTRFSCVFEYFLEIIPKNTQNAKSLHFVSLEIPFLCHPKSSQGRQVSFRISVDSGSKPRMTRKRRSIIFAYIVLKRIVLLFFACFENSLCFFIFKKAVEEHLPPFLIINGKNPETPSATTSGIPPT